jgi:Antibiotic biosynthesis monooxygenase
MPMITENGPFAVLVEFDVDPQVQQQLIEAVGDQVDETFARLDGFISASFHASFDGRWVVTYAQWESRMAWERATTLNAETTAHTRDEEWLAQRSHHNPVAAILHELGATTRSVEAFRVVRLGEAR